jgi:hypothetical protein
MKRAAFGLLCLFVLFPVVALADSLDSAAPYCTDRTCPTTFTQYDFEQLLAVKGTGQLTGTIDTKIDISGPAGTFTTDVSQAFAVDGDNGTLIVTLIAGMPSDVLIVTGRYAVTVRAIDDTAVRTIGPVYFDVVPAPVLPQPPLISVPEIVVGEADSPTGGHVTFDVSGFSFVDAPPAPTISCNHNSGDFFPLGSTTVSCTATDSFGSAFGSFDLFVTDSMPPVITVPANFSSNTSVVTYSVSAMDAVDGSRPVSCSPASGSAFPNGAITVTCSAEDLHANVSFASFVVTVSDPGQPPALTVPNDFFVEATGPAGAVVTYSVTASQNATVTCSPASGSIFGVGVNAVSCSATTAGGTTTAGFNVIVIDTVAPVLTVPGTIHANASSASGGVVTYTVSATDAVSGAAAVTCDPPSGSTFPIGTTTVQCYAKDASFNIGFGSFDVIVTFDVTPPTLSLPTNITAEATSASGRVVTYSVAAIDDVDGPVPVTCDHASGSTFPIALTTVTCTASDSHGNVASGSFTVLIRDTTPPALSLPANITAEASGPSGKAVSYTATATDLVDGSRPVTCDHASGSTFPLGTTTVQCTATDTHNNTAHGSFTVTVRDTTPPVIASITANPNLLWPPNHKMVAVTVSVIASDLVDPHPISHIISISSNQPINGNGDGNTSTDWEITGPLTANVRSERAGGTDRVYTLTIATVDASGNIAYGTTTVVVGQSRGHAVH